MGVREALTCKELQKAEIKYLCGAHVFLKRLLVLDQLLRMEIKSTFLILRFCIRHQPVKSYITCQKLYYMIYWILTGVVL